MALKVIGAGLGRTGTLSLKLALEHLGFGPCYHMTEIMGHARQRMPQWLEVVAGRPDWDAVFEGFHATVDYPTCTYWRELAAHYPEARIILSDRDAESWYASVRETIFAPRNIAGFLNSPVREFMLGAVVGPFVDRLDDRDFMIDWFNRWRDEVIAGLPPERLLVHRAADGWEPLCRFLGVPVPDEPYPRVNSKADMQGSAEGGEPGGERTLPTSPEAMEERFQAYLASMNRMAWG
ncbi:sulfotransferase family protein [Novosphingobium bradum]|uniref:Sulfotransferase family protein n=1 Tax=Novosphingobium bradum TaxID=1737444 RepID=A0ABV7IPA5_9SPHN